MSSLFLSTLVLYNLEVLSSQLLNVSVGDNTRMWLIDRNRNSGIVT